MNKFFKKLAVLLSFVMVFTAMPMGVFAEVTEGNALPEATVTPLTEKVFTSAGVFDGNGISMREQEFHLPVGLDFIAPHDETTVEDSGYADYVTEFFLQFDGLKDQNSFVANGCHLAGNYGGYAWVLVPLDGITIEDGVLYPVVSSVLGALNYREICTSVKQFKCGIYLSDEILQANPDLKVTLTLGLVHKDNYVIDTNNMPAVVTEATKAEIKEVKKYTYNVYELSNIDPENITTKEELETAVKLGGSFKLGADIAMEGNAGVTIETGKTVTLDLNGHTLKTFVNENKASQVITNKGTLTIVDNSAEKDGIITNAVAEGTTVGEWWSTPQANYATNVITNLGTLTVESGTIEQTAAGSICYAIDGQTNNGLYTVTTTIKDGAVIKSAGKTAIRAFANCTSKMNTINIEGGEITGRVQIQDSNAKANKGVINISGGTITSADPSNPDYYAVYLYGNTDASNISVNISGGTFNGTVYFTQVDTADENKVFNASISNGTFNGAVWSCTWGTVEKDIPVITGGTFSVEPEAVYVVEGYETKADGEKFIIGEHMVVEAEGREATCEEDGIKAHYTCEFCGKLYSDAAGTTVVEAEELVISALSHDWDEGVVTTEPTCTETGVKKYTCLRDSAHTYTEDIAIKADAHNWNEGVVTTEPTCTKVGVKTFTCQNNSEHTYTEDVAINEDAHDWDEGVVTTEPTCTEEGVKTFTCQNNSEHTYTEDVAIKADAHAWGEWKVTTEPTCTAKGVETRVCAHDGNHTETRDVAIKADAHAWGEWKVTTEPTCTEKGVETRVCAHDGNHTETRDVAIKADAHAWGEWKVTTEPTCTEKGVETRVCAHDGNHTETRDVAIKADAHAWGEWKVTTEPTCTEKGVETRVCAHDGNHTETRDVAIKADAHAYDEGKVTTKPTCTTKGVKTFTCQNDSTHTYTEDVAAYGHSKGIQLYDAAAHFFKCTVCGVTLEENAHTYDAKGNCTVCGWYQAPVATPAPTTAPTATPKPTATPEATTTPEPTTAPVEMPKEADTTVVEVKANETVVETVKETVTVSEGTATVDKAAVEAIVEATTEEESTVVIPLTQVTAETEIVNKAEVDTEALTAVAEAEKDVVIELTDVTVKLDAEAVKAVTEQANGATIEIRAVKVETHTLTETQQTVLADKETAVVITAQVFSDGEYIGDFKGGKATVMLPFTPEEGREAEHYVVYFLDDNGELHEVASEYVNGHMVFTTVHFSDYVIVYEGANLGGETDVVVTPETPAETTGSFPVLPIVIVIAIVVLGAVVIFKKKKSEN